MNDDVIYITVNDWTCYSDETMKFVEKLGKEEVDVNCNVVLVDMALFFYITTTESYIVQNNLDFLRKHIKEKTKFHPEYDLSKIGTDENYKFDFL